MRLHTEPAQWLTYSAEVAVVLSELHASVPFDLVDFPEYGGEGYVFLLNRTEWNYVPAVIHLHGPLVMFTHTMGWPEKDSHFYRVGTAMESTCFGLADAVYSSSRCSAEWCTRYYGERRDLIPTIHTGVDCRLFKPDSAPKPNRPTVVFAGRMDSNKGIGTLVDAACVLSEEYPELRLRIIGSGDPEFIESLRNKARDFDKPALLEFTGYVPREELPAHLNQAHVFAAPSVYEGGPGFVYLEAMACGLPVIACEGNGVSEVIRHQDNGFLIAPRDTPALVRILRALLADAELRRSIGLRARRFVEAEADGRVCLARLEAFYTSVARRCARKEPPHRTGAVSYRRGKTNISAATKGARRP
jgi:glycosyltransferase involved in cell wall biosynthesis